ncbi:preprotein translocase subunit SecY [Neoehrlichia mikurensis]|uniref:Protein translocase subunit SecY n=1 Tax=Neoehrlichia mikurensis TaxID=89586 RepID=A0A9Q9BXK8_9RICK|nr:preprotein translocase subunit SecY [Neoehrlichia mikurensis]QXK91809.1 preprotein translocase subunit SecY [Neoehrlichia mikurensis]QXK93022.1 preprotein translocase subunit SecY [Neoehrlichia mikurensis]QXK93500.1 preprotein translocase subunit SecY [Neoehrlichia mikurensis]UTO55546.1 preprotein translocase subunit SecY [Neoehrlichia mikurensis]UTO56467.1 preprotein translocase subunit SecY [Neoehrlichia mikurensis]
MLNENSWNKDGLLSKLWFTLMALIVYRLGTYIPIPGVNPDVIEGIVREHSVGVLGIFNLFSGGALGRMTIFALNVMPYIISSIIIQLFSVTIPKLNEMRQDGELGRTKINSYTRYLMIVFCLVQGLVILLGLEKMNTEAMTVVINPGLMFRVVGVGSLLGGTMFLLWLGEKINSKGIGNGISLIIFVGIVSELPGSFSSVFLLGKNGNVPIFIILLMLLAFVLLLILVIFIERSYRKVLVQYPKRQVKNRLHQGNSTYIPLKINISGVIPPIFANALLLSPITIANFHKGSVWSDFILTYFSSGKVLYVIFYALLIVFFAFFYTSFVFDAKETSEMLKKNGGFILGKRPGKSTCDYFEYLVKRLTVIGSMYLSVICILPEVFRYYHAISFTLGGTSFLIMVNVIIDTFSQIQTHIYSSKYSALIKKSDLWKKNK